MEFCFAKIEDKAELEQIQENCLEPLEHQDFSFVLSSDNYMVILAKINDSVAGFISASISFDQSDILQVCVEQKFRHQGIGKALLNEFENIMKQRGVKELFLEVNQENNIAIKLYHSVNFIDISKRKNYYGKNDAIVMKKTL